MTSHLLGAHMPAAGGLSKAIRRGKEIGCTAVQVFTSSPQMWKAKEVTDEAAAEFQHACLETGIRDVVSHDSYLVNLCAPDDEIRSKSIDALSGEVARCAKYGISRVVSHLGSHMGQGEEVGLSRVAEGLRQVLESTSDTVTVLAETTAGQGSALDYRFEHLAELLRLMKGHPRVGVCLDTCHIFAAGYDIRTDEAYNATFDRFGKVVGFDRLLAIHCNDSKKGLGSRVDRHEHLGKGEIGEPAFRRLVCDERFFQVPILVETPEAESMHEVNVGWLWSWTKTE